ncbi:MAG: hypothetical protein ACOH19_16545 [Rhodoglobus sp.]
MRSSFLAPIAAILLLAGCAAPAPTPTPSATISATPQPSETPHVIDTESLPTVEKVMETLTSSGDDSGEATPTFGALFAPGEQQYFENSAAIVPGTAIVRVACTTADGSDITITFTDEANTPIEFTAPCANATDGMTIVRSEPQQVEISTPYRFTVDTIADAAVAIGVVPVGAE